jgi:hypothetical protein
MSKRGRVISNIYFGADCFDDDDDDDEVADGQTLRVPALLMDSANAMLGRRPQFAALTDAQVAARRDARDEMIKRAEQAWRNPADARRRKPPDDENGNGDDPDEDEDNLGREKDRRSVDARAGARDAYHQMVGRLNNAWKTPNRDAVEPPAPHDDPVAAMRRHLGGADPRRAAAVAAETERAKGAGNIAELKAALERDRDRIHEQRKRDLESAWRR